MSNDLGYTPPSARVYKDAVTVSMIQGIDDNVTALANLLFNYKQGVIISYVDSNTLKVDTGSIVINNKLRRNTSGLTINWASTGGNAIAETSSTGYYIWAIASGVTSTFECAINQTAASMTGNANARLIGWFWNNTGNNIEGLWYKDQNEKKYYETPFMAVIVGSLYTFNHNLGTQKFTTNIFLSSVTGGGNTDIFDIGAGQYDEGLGVGFQIENVLTATVGIRSNSVHLFHREDSASYIDTGSIKLISRTLG